MIHLLFVFFQDDFQTETLLAYFLGNPFDLGYFHVSQKSSIPNRAEKVILEILTLTSHFDTFNLTRIG